MIRFLRALGHDPSDGYVFYPRLINFSLSMSEGKSQSVNPVRSDGKNPTKQLRQEAHRQKNLIKSTLSTAGTSLAQLAS